MRGDAVLRASPEAAAGTTAFDRLPRSGRAFRFGFCLVERHALDPAQNTALRARNWVRRRLGRFVLWTHPEADVLVIRTATARFMFVGDVYCDADGAMADQVVAIPPGDDAALYTFVDALSGRFALLVVEGERVRIFNDPIGSRSVFYHDGPPFAVASHVRVLAAAVGAQRCPDIRAYMADPAYALRKTNALPGDHTVFQRVRALVPNNLFDSDGMTTRRYWPRAPRRPSSRDQVFTALDAALGAQARFVQGRYHPVFGSTGGVDTRAAMAGFRGLGVPFETVTWMRDGLSAREAGIVDRLNAALGAPHTDLVTASDAGAFGRLTVANSGGLKSHWRIAAAVHAVYGQRNDVIFLRGWGAEVMRGFYNLWPSQMRDLSPGEMARAYYDPFDHHEPPAGTQAFFEGYHQRGNYAGVEAFGYDPNDLFYWEHRMGMWGAMCHNEMDVAIRSLVCFNSRPLFAAALGLPPEVRLTKSLLLDYVARNDPKLAEIPLDRDDAAPVARRHAASQTQRRTPGTLPRRLVESLRRLLRGLTRTQRASKAGGDGRRP